MRPGRSRLLQLVRWLLLPFGAVYVASVLIRNKLFDWGILPSKQYDLPVISVGNISVGGTGKTPHVEYLVRLLQEKDPAVLSRGYGRRTKGFRLVNENDEAWKVGDEPLQVRNKFPDIRVAVCESRVEGIDQLLRLTPPPGLVLLDDAFQHRYVKPGLSIVLVNYHHLIYNDWPLPAGRLREPAGGYLSP
jgi:tetraacyldisaccharide 4'-kinase